jgi:hypothetical protein
MQDFPCLALLPPEWAVPADGFASVQRDWQELEQVAILAGHNLSTCLIRLPIHRITGTAMLFPNAL